MAGKKTSGNATKRTRNWNIIVYPDSAPDNWRDILEDLHIEWVESPLHEFDTNPTGECKKPHWHCTLFFGGVKTTEQVEEAIADLNCPRPSFCLSAKGSIRYMAHLDNPEKFQYDPSKIIAHGGLDLADLLRPSATERYGMLREMFAFIRTEHIMEFQDLMDYAMVEKFDTWFPLLCDNSAYVIGQYIKSQRNRSLSQSSKQTPL